MRILPAALVLLAACPKPASPPPVAEPAPAAAPAPIRDVQRAADVEGAEGARAAVVGTLKRLEAGTAIVLDDGTAITVTPGEPPAGWDWLVGTRVRVQGALWAKPEPTLKDYDAPMPADVAMPMAAPELPDPDPEQE